MRRAWVVALTACGRIHFDPFGLDDAGSDGSPDAALQLIETIDVPATGEIQTSTALLIANQTYRLVARGTCDIAGVPNLLDAEFNFDEIQQHDLGDDNITDVGLGIDDTIVDGSKFPKWGPFRADHTYSIDFVGKGTSITARIHDAAFGNNTGQLVLEIYQ